MAKLSYAQEIQKLELTNWVQGCPKNIIENVYAKKKGALKFKKILADTSKFEKPVDGVFNYRKPFIHLTVYHSHEREFTSERLMDTSKIVTVDVFSSRTGEKMETKLYPRTGDSIQREQPLYRTINLYDKGFHDDLIGYKKINQYQKVEWLKLYKFDKRELLIAVLDYENGTVINSKIKIEYLRFDENGNWLKRRERTYLKDGTIAGTTLVTRTITYYAAKANRIETYY
ncbi:hypothetical protein [Mucilaginibacter pedocola]|nr:hypothetical protein [Mucilaginibacter pedocola]